MARTKNIKPTDCYEIKGGKLVRKKESCPKCGEGTFLAEHRNRKSCGRCSYTIFDTKK